MSYIWSGLTSQNRSGTSSFYLYDSQGSVRNLVNAAGAITDTYLTTAFGVELLTGSGTVNPFRYVGLLGYYRDMPELMQVRARWLAAVLARWLSRDPIGFGGGDWNLYPNLGNSPAGRADPSGMGPDKRAGDLIPCPAEVKSAKYQLCDNLIGLGRDGIVNTGCCTGQIQAQCLLDWCMNNGVVYCVKDSTGECNTPPGLGPCSFVNSTDGSQLPESPVYLCWPRRVVDLGCDRVHLPGATCGTQLVDNILHEVMHLCGTGQGGGQGISTDPAENRAQCLCGKMRL